jgi:hypothetical protein
LDLRLPQYILAEISAQILGRAKIDLAAAEQCGQFAFHARDAEQAGNVGGFELYKYIDVAVRTKIGSQHGPEKGHAADMSLPAKFRESLSVNRYVRHESTLPPFRSVYQAALHTIIQNLAGTVSTIKQRK